MVPKKCIEGCIPSRCICGKNFRPLNVSEILSKKRASTLTPSSG